MTTALIKEADFLEGAAQTILGKFSPSQWMSKPFETIFSAVGPMILWKISWPLGIMAFVGDHFGFGPGFIGKMIDEYIGAGSGKKLDLSDEKLQAASESSVDDFLKKIQGKEATSVDLALNELIKVKGSFEKEDIVVAFYVAKHNTIYKTAIGKPGVITKMLRFLGGNRAKTGLVSALYGILKMFGKGILGAAVVGGVASMISGGIGKSTDKEHEAPAPAEVSETRIKTEVKGQKYYSNVARNVEDTLIKFLDATIEGFSATFQKLYKKPLKGSKEMQEILNTVGMMNRTDVSVVNRWDAFMGPEVLDIAYKLMPAATYEKIETQKGRTEDPKARLTKLLGEV